MQMGTKILTYAEEWLYDRLIYNGQRDQLAAFEAKPLNHYAVAQYVASRYYGTPGLKLDVRSAE